MPIVDQIPPIPAVPERLRTAAQIGTLIPFIGAGVSRLAGCPGWDQFADSTLDILVDRGHFSHAQLDQIKHLDARIKLSIALSLQKDADIAIDFRTLLHPEPPDKSEVGRRIYSYLTKLGKTFVTTNYDEWLDQEILYPSTALTTKVSGSSPAASQPKRRLICHRPEDLTVANLDREDVVIHLHGSVTYPDGMIMTKPDYIRHYANDRRVNDRDPENYVLTFLDYLFREKTVLFIGYGLDELEILEYVIGKAQTTINEQKHFLLHGFFSHEKELMNSMRTYYAQCGIELLPFLKDERGWKQLIYVLESFGSQVPASGLMTLQAYKDMERLLDA